MKFKKCKFLIFFLILLQLFLVFSMIISSSENSFYNGTSFIFIDKFDHNVVKQFYDNKIFERFSAGTMIKLNSDIEVDKAGRIFPTVYLLDWGWRRILYNKGLDYIWIYGNQANEYTFNRPEGITAYKDGSIYIADTGNKKIVKLKNYKGNINLEWIKEDNFYEPFGISVDNDENIYVVDRTKCNIKKYDNNFNPINSFNGNYILGGYGT